MFHEWRAGEVEPGEGVPEPETWEPVTVPGKPSGFADADAVVYRTTFDDPRSDVDENAMLVLEGVYAHARLWLNGSLLAEHDAYFEPLRVPLGEALTAENELLVECRRPEDRFGGIYESDLVPDDEAVPGIWWGADVETYGDHHVVDLSARPRIDEEGARFEVRTTVLSGIDLDDRVTFSVKPEGDRRGRGMMNRAPVEAQAGEKTTVEHTIEIRDPALWWPHDMGEQDRYVVRAKLGEDERTVTTGLRSIEYDEGDGLVVNGRQTTGRGVNLLVSEPADVERAIEVNANLVRPHAHVPRPDVFEAADDAGVLVWSDLPLTGPGPFDIERGRNLLTRLVETYDHHPSLAAIGVHDDPFTLGEGGLGSGTLDRLRLRWRMWRGDYDRGAADDVASAIPEDFLALPVIGSPGIDHDATALYPGWRYGEAADVDWLLDRYPQLGNVVGEYGAASLGSDPDATDVAGFDRAIHDRRVERDREASQAYQQDVLETITERLRLHGTDLLVASALRDPAGAGMGVYTDAGDPKQAQQALADAFEPIQALLSEPRPGVESDVVVVNDGPTDVDATLAWKTDGTSGEQEISLEGNKTKPVTTVVIPPEAETIELSLSLPDRSVTNTYPL
ncbi:glycosyl hydrolase 2 galactose-binding domain-containing protein [Halorhabdus amylolytica]|uniref:glycosyl hydrolase 2 galactose-binding domain-containing protein n=1 Tax=Halorhabdus amylolytica TaxID=2559573 RepID=UPI0010AAB68E|nr:hydrolase [Halorhabdus amylolytica]